MTPAEMLAAAEKEKPRRTGTRAGVFTAVHWTTTLVDVRKRAGLTRRAAAKALGLSESGLAWIESGTDPLLSNAVKLSEFYGVPIGELWKNPRPKARGESHDNGQA